ncbi:MAG: Cof-type HAD-IIB family hydrolase [SAR202 cluster bacterium]|nr:Cof-type HAD-IIB family hydrolase [SAR202 cluster bacterium]
MGYRLIALDIDGTIRSQEHPLSDRTREAVRRVREAGAMVTVVTGRMFQSAIAASQGLDLVTPIVTFQGAHVADPVTKKMLWHMPLTTEMATDAITSLSAWEREVLAYYGDSVYVSRMTPWVEGYSQRNHGQVQLVKDLLEVAPRGLTRLVVVGEDRDIATLNSRLAASFATRLQITRSLPQFCEILHPEAGKKRALTWLAGHLDVGSDEVVAFGNGAEDLPMLQWAGLGVGMAGSAPEVLSGVHRVAPPLSEDGVARVLEELLGQGMIG